MKHFSGIDLGTTNSAIATYDGSDVRIWKSPEQNDVTPSVIYVDRRGNKYIGKRAYDSAPHSPDNAAMLFKRLMGSSTPISMSAVNISKTPVECSAEVLKALFGYLPEEIRNDPSTGTVITVPAAFNQMQKDATMQAADMAGIGSVALMQEPVAAVMSVLRAHNADGMFLIYDFGGGTLDIAVAESIDGRINLLAHGGIAMCGGRDFDRALVDTVVAPWLLGNFDLPDDFLTNPQFKGLVRLASWAAERAKIELSAREEAVISLTETEARTRDLNGNEVYLDIPLPRQTFDTLISERIGESIESAKETLSKAGLTPRDLERIVFVGGPTSYKPLRDMVARGLGIPGSTEVNPMTAVAEGASLFAESVDWNSQNRSRKSTRGQISTGGPFAVMFNYAARTPSGRTKIGVQVSGQTAAGAEFQIDSKDTGWTSGRLPLRDGASVEVTLSKNGENTFKLWVFDSVGGPIPMQRDQVVITRTAATVDAIPASHSVGIAALRRIGGHQELDYLVRAGDSLPKKGKKTFKAAESLKAGSAGCLNFVLWEGEIEEPIEDNRPVGVLKISGADFDDGVIPAGADLECEFEILDSGNIILEVSVPSIGGTFHSGKNFYSRQEGESDFLSESTRLRIIEDGAKTRSRIDEVAAVVEDPKLDRARQKADAAVSIDPEERDPEKTKEADEHTLEARKLLAQVRLEHIKEIGQLDLDGVVSIFEEHVREFARVSEVTTFESLAKTAQRALERSDRSFEHHLNGLRSKNFEIMWRQDWFVVERFKWMVAAPHRFVDIHRFEELAELGKQVLRSDEIDKLRDVVAAMSMIRVGGGPDNETLGSANILMG